MWTLTLCVKPVADVLYKQTFSVTVKAVNLAQAMTVLNDQKIFKLGNSLTQES